MPSCLLLVCDPLSLSVSGTSVAPPWFLMKYYYVQFCADHVSLQWVHDESVGCVMFLRCLSIAYLSIPWLLHCLCLFLNNIPHGGSDTAVLFRAERSTIMHSQHFLQLRVSALTAAHRNKKLLWRRVRLALIYGYKHVCIKSIWQYDHLAKMW